MPRAAMTREQERVLVGRLVAAEGGAWEEFVNGCHPGISSSVRTAGVRDKDDGEGPKLPR